MERISERDFLFIDETGDPGRDISGGSSAYFLLGCVHLTDLSLEFLHKHLFALGYFSGRVREWKSSRLSRLQKDQMEDIAKWLCEGNESRITIVSVDKAKYEGPYFGLTPNRPYDSIRFRHFLSKQLLECHFKDQGLMTSECEIIFDRSSAEKEEENLRSYLRGNFRLPPFTNISHCDSRYVLALQFVDALVHIVKEYLFGLRESVDGRILECVHVFDVTVPRMPKRLLLF